MVSPKVEAYSFGMINIDGNIYTRDIIILPEGVIDHWQRLNGHNLIPEDIQAVFEASPEILIVGSGSFDRMKISEAIVQKAKQAGIQLICLPTGEAWQVYNTKRDDSRVAAAFHLTC